MEKNNGKTLAIVGLVLGAVSLAFSWVPFFNIVTIACGIVGIVLSSKGKSKLVAAGQAKGLAVAGLIVSIVGLILSIIFFFTLTVCGTCTACALSDAASSNPELSSSLDELSSLLS